jgi:hypothetical protein
MFDSRAAARIRALHGVHENALSGMRDAVGRHLALRRLSRHEARPERATLARVVVDRRGPGVAHSSIRRRARDGVDGRRGCEPVLIRAPLSTTAVLDEAAEIVSITLSPWAAILLLTSLPYRFLQAIFLDQLFEVGSSATRYGNLLGGTANLIVGTVLLTLWGRAVYARACTIALGRGRVTGGEPFRVKPAAFACYVLTAAAAMLLGWVSLFTIVGFVGAVMFAGMAVGTYSMNERVSLRQPFRLILQYSKHVKIPFAIAFVFFVALLIAAINIAFALSLLTWLTGAIAGIDAPHWERLFSIGNRRYLLVLFAGALVVLEPFWVAAHVIYVRKAGAEESGEDLRTWFRELREAS